MRKDLLKEEDQHAVNEAFGADLNRTKELVVVLYGVRRREEEKKAFKKSLMGI